MKKFDLESISSSDIAIIGISARFPGANNPQEFWENLCKGVESITFFCDSKKSDDNSSQSFENHIQAGAILSDIKGFDADFFGYSEREAQLMDPQHRIFLECSWEALEDAGYDPHSYQGAIGVYAGMGFNSYLINNINPNYGFRKNRNFLGSMADMMAMIGNDKDYLPTRVSYKLDLKGPSVNVQTACSTSLVAVHMACQSLINGECDMALAGASSILIPHESGYLYQEDMVFSPDGHCRAFDEKAQGTLFGSGVAAVLLKPLRNAILDRDSIYGVIKGTAINNDGNLKVGYTAPSIKGQEAVISEALAVADIESDTITYVEAHGTATALGDPIEITALTQAFNTPKTGFCAIGSVKTNIGHLGWAAGMAGLIKTAFSLKEQKIPPSLHFKTPNPRIDFQNTPFYVNTQLSEWVVNDFPRRAGVSAFGIGGTNAHIILEELPLFKEMNNFIDRNWHILTFSARTPDALKQIARNYIKFFEEKENLGDIAFTLNVGRKHFEHRIALVASTISEAQQILKTYIESFSEEDSEDGTNIYDSENALLKETEKKVAFLFTGQGSQYVEMGKQLYETQPTFKSMIDKCHEILKHNHNISLIDILYPSEKDSLLLDQISYSQPALFSIEVALAELWISWGIYPEAVMGHSLGEYAAAYIAGVFSLEDGLKIVVTRSRLMQELPGNVKMINVLADKTTILPILDEDNTTISIAAENGPNNTTLSGRLSEMEKIIKKLKEKGIRAQKLNISRAGHSSEMDPILPAFKKVLDDIKLSIPKIKLVSNLTGDIINEEITTSEYWCQHLRKTVRYKEGMDRLARLGITAFIEIGPSPVLLSMGRRCLEDYKALWLPSLRLNLNDWEQILKSLAELYINGFSINWLGFDKDYSRYRIHLPTYPFQRKEYWIGDNEGGVLNTNLVNIIQEDNSSSILSNKKWKDWLYKIDWHPQPISFSPNSSHSLEKKQWLIFADKEIAEDLTKQFKVKGEKCILIYPGEDYKRLTEEIIQINPKIPTHYDKLLELLENSSYEIIYLWSLNSIQLSNNNTNFLSSTMPDDKVENVWNNCGIALYLFQALSRISPGNFTKIWLITSGSQYVAQDISEEGIIQSPLWSMARVVSMEHPELKCICVDLDPDEEGYSSLLKEEIERYLGEDRIAFRKGTRYLPRLTPYTLEEKFSEDASLKHLSSNGCYLITGGLTGIGLLVARWMIQKGASHLILTGRRQPSEEVTKELDSFKEKNIYIKVIQGDISELEDTKILLDQIENLGLPLKGIIHAAGVVSDAIIQHQTEENFKKVLCPKVQGSWNLHVITKSRSIELDFFVVFSSAVGMIGNPGQVNHAAANAFMDSLIHYRHSQGLVGKTINWGAWEGVGALTNHNLAKERLGRLGFQTISPEEGCEILQYILFDSSAPQLGVLPMNWESFLTRNYLENIPFFEKCLTVKKDKETRKLKIIQQLKETSKDKHYGILLNHVRTLVTKSLGVKFSKSSEKDLQDTQPISRYGLDSLSSIELKNSLQSTLGCVLPPTFILDHPSIESIVNYLSNLSLEENIPEKYDSREILKNDNKNSFPTLSMQQKRWLSLIRAGYGQRVIPIIFYTSLEFKLFRNALLKVVERHELLRYRFPNDQIEILEPQQVIPLEEDLFIDISNLDINTQAKLLGEYAEICKREMPNPSLAPSWAIKCLKLSEDKFVALLSVQHLEFDGTSLSTFVNELRDIYAAYFQGKDPTLETPVQYQEYAKWQEEYISRDIFPDRSFFEGIYFSLKNTTVLPKHPGFNKTTPYESKRYTPPIIEGQWNYVQKLAGDLGVSSFSILLAIYAKVISEVLNKGEVVIGMISSGRTVEKFKKTVGPFTAPFPIKISLIDKSLRDLIEHCNRLIATVSARSAYPVADLIKTIPAFKDFPIDTYFTDVCINFTNYRQEETDKEPKVKVLEILGPLAEPEFREINTEDLGRIPGLHLVINIFEGELRLNFWYHHHRFTEEKIAAWSSLYISYLQDLIRIMVPHENN